MTTQKRGIDSNETLEIIVRLTQTRNAPIYTEDDNTQVIEQLTPAALTDTFGPQVETIDRSDRR